MCDLKKGDIVTIRQWDDMAEEFGLAYGRIQVPSGFTGGMKKYCGKRYKVDEKKFHREDRRWIYTLIDISNGITLSQFWSSEMFEECKENKGYKLKYKVGDKVRIRSWKDMVDEFSLTSQGDIMIPRHTKRGDGYDLPFTKPMKRFCGKIFEILHVFEDTKKYELKGAEEYGFTDGMLEDIGSMVINLQDWLKDRYGNSVAQEYAANFLEYNHHKRFDDVFNARHKLDPTSVVSNFIIFSIAWASNYGYDKISWESVHKDWKSWLQENYTEKGIDLRDIKLTWGKNWGIVKPQTQKKNTIQTQKEETMKAKTIDGIIKINQRVVTAISRRYYTSKNGKYKGRKEDIKVLVAIVYDLYNAILDEKGEDFVPVGNIRWAVLMEKFNDHKASQADLLDIISMFRHHKYDTHEWVLEEAKNIYRRWLTGDGKSNIAMFDSNHLVIAFNAKKRKILMLRAVKDNWVKYETKIDIDVLISVTEKF